MSRVLAVLALCVPLFFVGLSSYDLDTKGEPREGFTAWEMIHSGEWTLPHLNGEVLPEKPLVFPWLVAGSTLLLGEGGELAPRLPSALMAVGLVLLVFALGKRLRGDGFTPAVICATTALVISLARRARVDMTLSFFVTLSLLQFLRALEKPRWTTIVSFWLAVSVATLTKGPIGIALPTLAGGTFLYLEGRLGEVKRFIWGLPIFILIAGTWYAQGRARGGAEFTYRTFLMENVLMFVGAKSGGGHVHGTFYYFKYLPSHVFPWSIYLPFALYFAWKHRRERSVGFALGWLGSLFLFFSIARGKRGDYLLPLMPAVALLVADLWRRGKELLLHASTLGLLLALGALGAFALPQVRALIPIPLAPVVLAAAVVGVALVGIAPAWLIRSQRENAALGSIAAGMAVLALAVALEVMPAAQKTHPFVEEVARTVGDGRLVQDEGLFDYVSLYYLRRRIPTVRRSEVAAIVSRGGFVLVSREAWRELPNDVRGQVAVVASDRLLLGHGPR